ncbi:hypothetical protein EV368DRAFT_77344 [Lentinula lateritia]|nr:hypothetical protein EV368DRAFT_77344 [Lentinula lateritia]
METHSADTEYLVRKGSNTGYRILSILTPPAYTVYVLARHGRPSFSLNGLLRSTWIGGIAGAAGGAGIAFARYNYTNAEKTGRIRAEDHATIGGVLLAVLTPAVFWNRARVANLILGGAGIGTGVGMIAHWTRSITGDTPKPFVPA